MNIYTSSLIFVKRNTKTVNQEHKNGYLWRGKGEGGDDRD